MPIKDRYDGITIGDLLTERWFEKNAVIGLSLGKTYNFALREDLDAQDVLVPPIKNLGIEDDSNVYQIVKPSTNRTGSTDVLLQDPTNPLIIAKMSRLDFQTVTVSEATINTRAISVPVGEGVNFLAGTFVTIFNVAANRFYLGEVVVRTLDDLIMDTLFDFTYDIGSIITAGTTNMNAVGTANAPVYFKLRNTEERVEVAFDITRIIMTCLASSAVSLNLFANIPKLAYGIAMRRNNGILTNYFNAKSNFEITALGYDFEILSALNPAQGQDGFKFRLTFSGQEKMGAVVRISETDDLELLVQDDLSLITLLEVIAEGHLAID